MSALPGWHCSQCSFCGETEKPDRVVIVGPVASICEQCVLQTHQAVLERKGATVCDHENATTDTEAVTRCDCGAVNVEFLGWVNHTNLSDLQHAYMCGIRDAADHAEAIQGNPSWEVEIPADLRRIAVETPNRGVKHLLHSLNRECELVNKEGLAVSPLNDLWERKFIAELRAAKNKHKEALKISDMSERLKTALEARVELWDLVFFKLENKAGENV